MSKEQTREIFTLATQIIPFLMITATLISLAYAYGRTLSPLYVDNSLDLIRLSCNYLP